MRIPRDVLLLEAGRLPEDVHDAFQKKTAEAVAAIRQCTETQVVSYPITPPDLPLRREAPACEPIAALPERIDVRKTSASYRAHSYHTKIPPEALRPFIATLTRPGELVFDPFCGSGMTGVAALMENRNALLSDFSPSAVHIARNYTTPCHPNLFADALARVEKAIKPTVDWLYRPIGSGSIIEYTTWSDVFRCARCRNHILYWDCVQRAGDTSSDGITCPQCATVKPQG